MAVEIYEPIFPFFPLSQMSNTNPRRPKRLAIINALILNQRRREKKTDRMTLRDFFIS